MGIEIDANEEKSFTCFVISMNPRVSHMPERNDDKRSNNKKQLKLSLQS